MKKFLGAVGLIAIATSASAADLAPRQYARAAPIMAAPVAYYDWSGIYVGANGGYGSSGKCWDYTTSSGSFIGTDGCHNATGAVAGGQLGYRWQMGAWVFGVEAQYDWANLNGSNVSVYNSFYTDRTRINSFGLFTGQIGYAFNNALLYVKGGAAVTDDRFSQTQTLGNLAYTQSASASRWGSVVGVGLEYGFAPSWSLGFEYDHLFMGTKSTDFTYAPTYSTGYSGTDRIRQDADLFTVRLNYHFGMGKAPVVARY